MAPRQPSSSAAEALDAGDGKSSVLGRLGHVEWLLDAMQTDFESMDGLVKKVKAVPKHPPRARKMCVHGRRAEKGLCAKCTAAGGIVLAGSAAARDGGGLPATVVEDASLFDA